MFRTLAVAAAIVFLTAVPAASQDRTTSQLLQHLCLSLSDGSFSNSPVDMNMKLDAGRNYTLQQTNGIYGVSRSEANYGSAKTCRIRPPVSVTRDQLEKSVSDSIGPGWVRTTGPSNPMVGRCSSSAPTTYETIWTRRPGQSAEMGRVRLNQNVSYGVMGCEDPAPGFNLIVEKAQK